ncbi:hypothetical protein [Tsukamurella hominis]|uniref:hypothetical protein n=1 Tax=Tsukamurella hominis TaxID=1970232 RepID=UPI0039ED2ED9
MTESFWTYLMRITDNASGVSISRAAEVDAGNVSRWKTGRSNPSAESVVKIARTWGRSPVEALVASGHLRQDEVDGVVELGLDVSALSDDDLIAEVLRRMKGATDADQPDRSDPPTSTEDAEDEAREDQKTRDSLGIFDAPKPLFDPHPFEEVPLDPVSRIGLNNTALTAVNFATMVQWKAHETLTEWYADREKTLAMPLEAPAREVHATLAAGLLDMLKGAADMVAQYRYLPDVRTQVDGAISASDYWMGELKEMVDQATSTVVRRQQVEDLAPSEGKPHDLRGTQDPFDDPNPEGAEWPDGTVVTDEEKSGYLQWLAARQPADFEPYRAGERNDYDLAARENDERKGSDDAGLDEGEE